MTLFEYIEKLEAERDSLRKKNKELKSELNRALQEKPNELGGEGGEMTEKRVVFKSKIELKTERDALREELAELKVIVRELLAADSRKDIFDRLRRAVEED